ncbi:MAG TPA: nucleotide exchange factor GrpE [Candidatus Saccharimonadaceae bacterium]|nr:nucleotide exchange factor GrpE [Candidatus Saccharimonadaceae bacterium]
MNDRPDDPEARSRVSGEGDAPPLAGDAASAPDAPGAGAEPLLAADDASATDVPPAPDVDYKDRWLRAEADLQNFRRRAQRDVEEARRAAEERVLLEIVAAIDDLERALDSARAAAAADAYVQGVQLVAQRLSEYLARQGVIALDPLGQPFDPRFHEALLEVPAAEGARPGDVVQVALKGYRRGERALRAARVVVARRGDGA